MAFISTASFAQFKFGGGLTLGSKVSIDDDLSEKMGIGLNIRGDYSFNDALSVSPGFTLFFPSAPGDVDITLWQLNADAHYNFYNADGISIYGLGGLNYRYAKVEDFDDSEIGLDLGVGANFNKFFGEIKYDTAFEQVALSVGIMF